MAAGRDNVLRRRESHKYNSIKEFDHYSNGSCGVAVHRSSNHHHITYKNGRRTASIFEDSGPGRIESYGRRDEREQGEFCRDYGDFAPASGFQQGDGEVEDSENAFDPPEKRRKISPIVWDLTDKETKISSKNMITQVTSSSPSCPSQPSSHGASSVYHSEAVNPESPADFSSALHQEHSGDEGKDVEQSDEKHVQGWNITMSRWLSDDDSPRNASADDGMHVKESSSPESGEFRGVTSEGKKARSSSSGGDHHCCPSSKDNDSEKELRADAMADNDEHSETSYVSHLSSDSEDNGSLVEVQRNKNMLVSCRSVFEFEMIKKINEGTYGVVYKAKDKKTGEIVALKKVKMNVGSGDGFPLSALREINILLSFNHPSIVDVKEVAVDDFDGFFIVMEHMDYDLKGLMQLRKRPFSVGEIKSLMMRLLEGVKYLHDNWILHRDLKTSNILLNKEGELKICDFGLSRQYGSPIKPYTPLVVTLWYRAPELLLGAKEYSTAIDMWSVGCIMAELVAKVPLFKGKSEVEQLNLIFQILGTPNEKIWPGVSKLSGFKANFVNQPHNMLRKKFPVASFTGSPVLSEMGFDLLSKLLTYDPEKRISAEAALHHDWFREAPLPKSDFNLTFPSQRC